MPRARTSTVYRFEKRLPFSGRRFLVAATLRSAGTRALFKMAERDARLGQIVRRHLERHLVAGKDNVNNDRIPVRFAYPRREQTLNAASRDAAVAAQGADDYNTKVWWDE